MGVFFKNWRMYIVEYLNQFKYSFRFVKTQIRASLDENYYGKHALIWLCLQYSEVIKPIVFRFFLLS